MISCTSVGCLSVPAKGLSYGCTKMLDPYEELIGQTCKMATHLASLLKLLSAEQELLTEALSSGLLPARWLGSKRELPRMCVLRNPGRNLRISSATFYWSDKVQIPRDQAESSPCDGRSKVALRKSM